MSESSSTSPLPGRRCPFGYLGLRVNDADRSIAFYTAVGYQVVGRVMGTPIGDLTMLKLPGDEFVTIELVHAHTSSQVLGRPDGTLSHLVVATGSINDTVADLLSRGIGIDEPASPNGPDDPITTMIVDPDGNEIELVEWPPGHPAGFTAADFTDTVETPDR